MRARRLSQEACAENLLNVRSCIEVFSEVARTCIQCRVAFPMHFHAERVEVNRGPVFVMTGLCCYEMTLLDEGIEGDLPCKW